MRVILAPRRSKTHLIRILGGLVLLIGGGTAGYCWIEGWSLIDSLYMVLLSVSTVGYGEVHPLSEAGRIFTMVLLVAGVGLATYTIGSLTRMVVEGEIQALVGRRRAMSKMRQLSNHYIICGYGRIGGLIAGEFERRPLPFVVVEKDEATIPRIPQEFPVVIGDATEEQTLINAGIERAKGLVTVLRSDADNLFVTLTARELNRNLFILARYEEPRTENKLLRAGADKVVSPYIIGGTRMAMAVLRPSVIDFLELAIHSESLGLQMEEVLLVADSPLAGVALAKTSIRSELDIIIVAIVKSGGEMKFNPSATTVLEPGDKLIAIGERDHLRRLEAIAGGGAVAVRGEP